MISYIEITIKNIYLKNKKVIDKFYLDKKNNVFNKYKITTNEIIEKYIVAKIELDRIMNYNKKVLLEQVIDGKINTKDYTEEKIKNMYSQMLNKEVVDKINSGDKDTIEEVNKNVLKFIHSIYEYKNYLKYKFIFDDIKQKFQEKDKYKNSYKENLKQIEDAEKHLKKINKNSFFSKKEQNGAKEKELFEKIKEQYKELDKNSLYYNINKNLMNSSSIYDVFKFSSCYYKYLVLIITKQYENMEQNEIDYMINEFKEFTKFPYFTILNNIYMMEEKDIAQIIKDKYKLLNFNIEKSDLDEENINNLLENLNKINIKNNIDKSGLTIEKMNIISKLEKIVRKEQN